MQEFYNSRVITSFSLWLENRLATDAKLFVNQSGTLYEVDDNLLPNGYCSLSSPSKQWVYNKDASDAIIPSGITIDGNFLTRDSGVMVDFNEGRFIIPESLKGSIYYSEYSVKEFNIYNASSEEVNMVFEGTFQINSRYKITQKSGVVPYSYTVPACFISQSNLNNDTFAFGGHEISKSKFRVIAVSDYDAAIEACISVCVDSKNKIIPLLYARDYPIDAFGDLKSGQFSYAELSNQRQDRYLYIDKVYASKITSNQALKLNPNLRYALIDFYLSEPRVPQEDYPV